MSARHRLAGAVVTAALGSACTFAPGGSFATLAPAPLTVAFTPGDGRLDSDGWLKTDLGYRLKLETLTLTIDRVAFQSQTTTGSGTGSTVFDPAKPPPDYTLCHGGHCHRKDGALVDYADVQAELAGGGTTTLKDVLTLPLTAPVNLLKSQSTDLPFQCPDGCQVDQGTWSRAEIRFGTLEASGTTRDGSPDQRLGRDGQRSWRLTWTPPAMGKAVSLTVSRKSPATVTPTIRLNVSDQLFDQIDWSTIPAQTQPVALEELPAIVGQVTENLAQSTFSVRFDHPQPAKEP